MTTVLDISPEQLAVYRATAQHRREQERQMLERRRIQAWELARTAANLLEKEYDADRVVLYGSLARGHGFHLRSDVDLAASGVPPHAYLRAIGRLLDLDPSIEVNLVLTEEASPSLLASIHAEGIEL